MSLAQALPAGAEDARIRAMVAGELDRIREAIEEIGALLCADPAVAARHFMALQGLDEICQRNENLARVLRSADMAEALGAITLASLRARMLDAMEPAGDRAA